MKIIKFLLFVSLFYIVACSATKETEKEASTETQSVYVFDDISTTDSVSTIPEEVPVAEIPKEVEKAKSTFKFFIVQVGAFSTLEKAETFVRRVKNKIDYELIIHLRNSDNLQIVELPPFRTRDEAEKVKDELRTIPAFEGTFISTK